MRSLLMINPQAGPWWRRRLMGRVVRRVHALLPDVQLCTTTPERRADRLCAEAVQAGFDRIIVAGGDGTIHEAVNGLAGSRAILAMLPMGTSNVLAREIGLPADPLRACQSLRDGGPRPIALGQVNHRYFVLMVGAGVDGEVVRRVEQRWHPVKRWAGAATYVAVGLATLASYRYPRLQVVIGNAAYTATTAIIANARTYGGVRLAPDASLQDPTFRIGLFHRAGLPAYLAYTAQTLLGRAQRMPGVTWLTAPAVTLSADSPVPVQADGELVGRLPCRIAIAPSPLSLWYPLRPAGEHGH